jgi:hypothetical protein
MRELDNALSDDPIPDCTGSSPHTLSSPCQEIVAWPNTFSLRPKTSPKPLGESLETYEYDPELLEGKAYGSGPRRLTLSYFKSCLCECPFEARGLIYFCPARLFDVISLVPDRCLSPKS